jgi:hypothetical protein
VTVRLEQEIFDDLVGLCASPGYAHAIAFLCYRDHIVGYGDELKAKDYAKLFSRERLIRTEVATLIGMMLRSKVDFAFPGIEAVHRYIDQTESLLHELHNALLEPSAIALKAALGQSGRA